MERNITVIPARANRTNLAENMEPQRKRMAAYCRVSTDQSEQLSSYEAQVNYYTNFITNHPDYDLAGIYADEGISGTGTKKRDQFNKMIADCKKGKIDGIITKSISRFARNTLDCLNFVRLLKDLDIGVTFEKENIHTLDSKGEVLLSILSSLAQDESRTISENCTWGIRRRFEQGKVIVNTTKFLGYDKDENGNLVINEKQALVIKRIYNDYLSGKSANCIAKELEQDVVLNWNGTPKWYDSTIRKILSNEKYKGDALLQKTYTVDFLKKTRAENNGEINQYYVEDSHPAIIDKDTWEAVQLEKQRKRSYAKSHDCIKREYSSVENPMAGKVICGACGKAFGRKVWNSTDERLRRVVWRCNAKYKVKGKVGCTNKHIDDVVLEKAFIFAFNAVIENKDYFVEKWIAMAAVEDVLKREKAKQSLKLIERVKPIREFDAELFHKLVVKMTVHEGKIVVATFFDGSEVECSA